MVNMLKGMIIGAIDSLGLAGPSGGEPWDWNATGYGLPCAHAKGERCNDAATLLLR